VLTFGNILSACVKEYLIAAMYQCQVKVEVCDRIASGYLRGTTYLRTPFFGNILVVTLVVIDAEAVV